MCECDLDKGDASSLPNANCLIAMKIVITFYGSMLILHFVFGTLRTFYRLPSASILYEWDDEDDVLVAQMWFNKLRTHTDQ